MSTFLTVIYVIVCLFLILVVLLQAGKGGGLGALSGGSTQSVFGGAGAANFMTRLTMVVAALFMFLSATLAYMSSSGQRTLDEAAARAKSLGPGEVRPLGDDIIHSVTNPTSKLTGAIHVYGGDFFAMERSEWETEGLEERPYDIDKNMKLFEAANN